jgi:hypothetical protein
MKNTNLYIGIVVVFIIAFFILIMKTNDNQGWDNVIKAIEKDEYYGIVKDKFIDTKNHNTPIVVLASGKKITLYGQQWSRIDIGDSLSKRRKSTIIEVIKPNELVKIDQKAYLEHLKMKNK